MPTIVKNGDLIGGRYQIRAQLGSGGMGVVFEATHLQLRQRVAIKVLIPELCQDAEAVARFLREARAMVKINSEHVARVTDVGTLDSGEPFIVMEYLEGSDLAAVLKQTGRVSVEEAVTYILQASEAIAEAHALGVIHRDLKPSNLFLTRRRDGSCFVKVLDFGISKAAATVSLDRTSMRTATSVVMGSPIYMSPEQVRSSKNVDPRSDIWSLGVLLHELLTGSPPFSADTMPGLVAKIIADPPIALRAARPEAPAALEEAILRCLAKDPNDRFQTVGEFAAALEPFAPQGVRRYARTLYGVQRADGEVRLSSSPAPPGVEGRMSTSTPAMAPARAWAAALGAYRKSPGLAAILGAALGVMLGIALWAAFYSPMKETALSQQSASTAEPDNPHRQQGARPPEGEVSDASSLPADTAPREARGADPVVTPLTPARWAALEEAAMASNGVSPTKPVPTVGADRLFGERK